MRIFRPCKVDARCFSKQRKVDNSSAPFENYKESALHVRTVRITNAYTEQSTFSSGILVYQGYPIPILQ